MTSGICTVGIVPTVTSSSRFLPIPDSKVLKRKLSEGGDSRSIGWPKVVVPIVSEVAAPSEPEVVCADTLLKQVKRGFREVVQPIVCGVIFETLPAWLWAIRSSEFSTIVCPQANAAELKHSYASTWKSFESKLLIIAADKVPTVDVDVWLVSGSRNFLVNQPLSSQVPVVTWLMSSGRRKPLPSSGTQWISISHRQVGGTTNLCGMFGVRQLKPLKVEVDPITRTIAHIIKYSERPFPCAPELLTPHYRLTDRLSGGALLEQPVLLPSHFSGTGWGQRKLIPSELAHAFDLPGCVPWDPAWIQGGLIPIHLFRVVLDQVLPQLQVSEGPALSKVRLLPPPVMAPAVPPDGEFLVTIQKWLPGSWSDESHIADKAVKSDNAQVNRLPWHRRISLIFPRSAPVLGTLETLALTMWRKTLFRSFHVYLRRVYGPDWQRELWSSQQVSGDPTLQTRDGFQATRGASLPPAKRCRRVNGSQDRGVVQEVGDDGAVLMVEEIAGNAGEEGGEDAGLDGKQESERTRRLVDLSQDVALGRSVLSQICASTWWDWSNGSSLVFWRWNGREQIRSARDGMEIFVQSSLPRGRNKAKRSRLDPGQQAMVVSKLEGMLHRTYLEPGFVSNALHYFAVPKGDSDIRVVFDGTSSGLNETLWAPNFYLPTARAAALNMSFSTWMSDMDCGEMFHNFFMDSRIRKCAGIQVDNLPSHQFRPNEQGNSPGYLRWTRLFMGMRPSPYNAVRHYYWAEEFAKGNPNDEKNPMSFDEVKLNLPGMKDYNPTLPKVMKWNSAAHSVAGDVITFVDDVRITGFSKENCRNVHHQFASRIQYLGMQDAPRKFRPPSQDQAGAWTGTIFRIQGDAISQSVSQDKWDKGKAIIQRLKDETSQDLRPMLNRKSLEKETGFLNHLTMTFEFLNPFLKGFYLTLNSWRDGRDLDDWKVSDKLWMKILKERLFNSTITDEEFDLATLDGTTRMGKGDGGPPAPEQVRASTRFASDVAALWVLFNSSEHPPLVNIRSKQIVTVIYGFGDASGSGLGATFTCGTGFNFRVGVWGEAEQPESSNWKEFTNVVESLEEEGAAGNLSMTEVFMFTDNSTVESCAAKGSSTSRKLLDLIIRLQALTTRLGIKIHIFHVAGTRMIAQGTDGVSRGYLGQGVMSGESMSMHIPIYLTAIERAPPEFVPWVRSWSGRHLICLDPKGWYQAGHDIDGWRNCEDGFQRPILKEGRFYLWTPPPFAADVAIAELRKARIKRQRSTHIFVCPRLCTTLWQKHLFKSADIVFEVPVGSKIWPDSNHEPLLIGLFFPFLRCKPWQLRGTPKMHAVGRDLRGVLQTSHLDAGDLLRKLRVMCEGLHYVSEPMVRKLLYFQ
jgi:hypothetical protein